MDFANNISNHAALWSALRVVDALQTVQREGRKLFIHPEVDYEGFVDDCVDIIASSHIYPGAAEG